MRVIATAFVDLGDLGLDMGQEIVKSAAASMPVHSIKLCLLYDARSGHIHHQHRVLTLVGGEEPSEEDVVGTARRLAAGRQPASIPDLLALHIPSEMMQCGKRYRVDVERKALVLSA